MRIKIALLLGWFQNLKFISMYQIVFLVGFFFFGLFSFNSEMVNVPLWNEISTSKVYPFIN